MLYYYPQHSSRAKQEKEFLGHLIDILLASTNHAKHMLELSAVFQRLTDFGLCISPLKCEFGAISMEFLGHLINKDGITPLPEKVAAMRSYETPRTAKELRRYLGMINFYRRFVPKSAETQQPLYDLINELNNQSKNARITWSSEQQQAFEKYKTDLANASNLAYPAPDEPLYLATDASDTAVGAVLYQKSAAVGMRPLGFFSRHLNSSQLKWTIFSRELLAVYLAAKHFSYFLEGSLFTIQTDHQALVSAAANAKPRESSREVRHLQYLTTMRPKWEFITGSKNNTADSDYVRSLQDYQPTINSITSSLLHHQYEALRTHQACN